MHDQLTAARTATAARNSMGERVRQLRIARGLTQTELAGERFSKEYVSQIERGKTRPTGETVEWLASRLGVDPSFLETGVSSSERERVESVIARAEAAIESNQYEDVVVELDKLGVALTTVAVPSFEFRSLLAESWARMSLGDVRAAIFGLTLDAGAAHLARAALEAAAYQTRDLADAMIADGGAAPNAIRVDGGMAANDWFCLFLADILTVPVERPSNLETTALGVAFHAGLAMGVWSGLEALPDLSEASRFEPRMGSAQRERMIEGWKEAVARTLGSSRS